MLGEPLLLEEFPFDLSFGVEEVARCDACKSVSSCPSIIFERQSNVPLLRRFCWLRRGHYLPYDSHYLVYWLDVPCRRSLVQVLRFSGADDLPH